MKSSPAEYGAAYLDEHDPGWADRIDLTRFDIHDPCRCVLGQLYSANGRGGFGKWHTRHGGEFLCRLGFDVSDLAPAEAFLMLTAEWSRLISDRQSTTTEPAMPVEANL